MIELPTLPYQVIIPAAFTAALVAAGALAAVEVHPVQRAARAAGAVLLAARHILPTPGIEADCPDCGFPPHPQPHLQGPEMKLSPFGRRRPTPADLAPVPVPVPAAPKPAEPPTRAEFTLPPAPASAVPGPVFAPGRYVVRYDRNVGPVSLTPLTVVATSAADLTEQIRADLEPWLGARIEITVDMTVSGGKIRAGATAGTFVFTRGGVRR